MSTSTVYDAIKSKLVADLGGTYPIRDWEEIEVSLQQADASWLVVEDGTGTDELNSIGTPSQNWVTDSGFLDVHIMIRSDLALSTARGIGDQVRASLRYYQPSVGAGETLRVNSVSPPNTGLIADGLWHSMFVSVGYYHQYAVATAAE